jgi:hypothetical protein
MVIVPVLDATPELVATAYPTVPLPVPVLPDVNIIHDALLVAVHGQLPVDEVTLILPLPPSSLIVFEAGDTLTLHVENVAVIVVFALIEVEQDPDPEHPPPLQLVSDEPLAGMAVREAEAPEL